jgi:hypothetical protein
MQVARRREAIVLTLAFLPGLIWIAIVMFAPIPLGIAEVNRSAVTSYRLLLMLCVVAAVTSLILAGRYAIMGVTRVAVMTIAAAAATAFLLWAVPLILSIIN